MVIVIIWFHMFRDLKALRTNKSHTLGSVIIGSREYMEIMCSIPIVTRMTHIN
jgi:hypothetical protein